MKNRLLIFISILVHCQISWSQSPSSESMNSGESVISVFDKPVEFGGWKGEVITPGNLTEIKIGLFMPFDRNEPVAGPILQAAELAISEFNSSGGYYGVPFRLKTRWSYDPWRSGAREMIKLVYEDSVWAVIGSLDGTTTHIAQQIITKARVPLLSPISADPTLTYVRIPWIFRLPPDFEIQSSVICQQGIQRTSIKKVGLVTSVDHDGRTFAREMIQQLWKSEISPVFHFEIFPTKMDITELLRHLNSYDVEAMIWYLPPGYIKELMSRLAVCSSSTTIIIPWIVGVNIEELSELYPGTIFSLQPFSLISDSGYSLFDEKYCRCYGIHPPAAAAYTYDAIQLLVLSMFKSGLNRSRLRDELAGIGTFEGVTGKICWDNGGGNITEPLLKILPGTPDQE